jgi:hypothetical protein
VSAPIDYELIVAPASVTLTCGGEVMWTSDGDAEFLEEFGEEVVDYNDDEQLDDVIGWLVDYEYIPPSVEVDILEDNGSLEP